MQFSVATDGVHPQVDLELRISGSQTSFHIGEVIPVKLIFSSLDHTSIMIGEDCMGHGTYRFHATPEGFIDRASERDAAGFGDGPAMCHGWPGQVNDLAEKPFVVDLDLNSYFRIETSGHYKVSVTTTRLGSVLTSNAVDVQILPHDAAWEKQELTRAVGMLKDCPTGGAAEGCKVLGYLETRDAELEMARSYEAFDYCDQMFYPALINARNRKLVLDELDAGIAQPDRAIREGYLSVLAKVSLYQQHPNWYPEPIPEDAQPVPTLNEPHHARSILWKTPGAVHREELHHAEILADEVTGKTGEARAVSLETLLELDNTFMGDEVPAKYAQLAREQLPAVFLNLPIMDQDLLLQRNWPGIGTPAMIPVLKQIVEHEIGGPRGLALQRLTELSPDDARPIIVEGLRSGTPYQYWEISRLPDKELPELDAVLLGHLKKQLPNGYYVWFYAPYLSRYASAAIEGDVKALIDGKVGTLSARAEACIVAYLLRVDRAAGMQVLREELSAPASDFLLSLAEFTTPQETDLAALIALNNPDPGTQFQALALLQRYGSAEDKAVLLSFFRAWSRRWQLLPEQLSSQENHTFDLEGSYLNALAMPQMWLPSADDIEALESFCVREDCRDRAAQMAAEARKDQFDIRYTPSVFVQQLEGMFSVGQYNNITGLDQLKQKLAQYPKGTVFTVRSDFAGYAQTQRVYESLRPLAAEHGFQLNVEQKEQFSRIFMSMF